jgi:hypothetical protein
VACGDTDRLKYELKETGRIPVVHCLLKRLRDEWLDYRDLEGEEEDAPRSAWGNISGTATIRPREWAGNEGVDEDLDAALYGGRFFADVVGESAQLRAGFRAIVEEPLVSFLGRGRPVFVPPMGGLIWVIRTSLPTQLLFFTGSTYWPM